MNSQLQILLVEPYYTGSHKSWADSYKENSNHQITILSLKGQFWKWRMHGGAVTLAKEFNRSKLSPDLIVATDMLDLTTFLSLTRAKTSAIPTAIYFHENQLSYPWSPSDRDVKNSTQKHYGFINYTSALTSDHVIYNSNYHKSSFENELKALLKNYPDHNELDSINGIQAKGSVLNIGLDLKRFNAHKNLNSGPPLILWNHRWEYDKNPDAFFKSLFRLDRDGVDFQLAVLGESFNKAPAIFNKAEKKLKKKIVHFGYCESFDDYAKWLWKSDIIPVTNIQDFFGMSIMEAVYCDTYPLLPNRLTYPELLDDSFHNDHIYQNENDLFFKLEKILSNIDKVREMEFNKIASVYDWSIMVKKYDNLFSSFIK